MNDQAFEVLRGERAVWVNGLDGSCIGRFGRMGIDIHRSATEQLAGAGECLFCTHTKTTPADWTLFQTEMLKRYGIDLSAEAPPRWLAENHHAYT